jgi:hypothetical protein
VRVLDGLRGASETSDEVLGQVELPVLHMSGGCSRSGGLRRMGPATGAGVWGSFSGRADVVSAVAASDREATPPESTLFLLRAAFFP